MKIQELFISELCNCKEVSKEDIIMVGEECGLTFSNREAKIKIINKIIDDGHFQRLFDYFQEFIYIPVWTVADYYKMNSQQIDELKKIGAIKEDPIQKEFYSRKNKDYYYANTYPLDVLNYNKDKLQEEYKQAFKQEGFKIRLETETKEDVQKLINEFSKLFKVSSPSIYERRNQGYNSYFEIKVLNNSYYENNRLLNEINELKAEIKRVKQQGNEDLKKTWKGIEDIFGTTDIFELHSIKSEYDKMKEIKNNNRGAGRKPKFTEEEKEIIRKQRQEGKTFKELAELNSCSVGVIHKLINEKEG